MAPIKQILDMTITDLESNDAATQAAIEQSIRDMLFVKAAPGQTIYRSWVEEAISNAVGEDHHNLIFDDAVMPAPGYMAVLGTILYRAMTDRHVRRTGDDYVDALAALLPIGPAWPREPDTRADGARRPGKRKSGATSTAAPPICWKSKAIRARRSNCCRIGNATLACPIPATPRRNPSDERQLALVMRMTMLGAQSREFFIGIAAQIGYHITITEYRTFVVGLDRVGDAASMATRPIRCSTSGACRSRTPRGDGRSPTANFRMAILRARSRYQPLLLDRPRRPGKADLVSLRVGPVRRRSASAHRPRRRS